MSKRAEAPWGQAHVGLASGQMAKGNMGCAQDGCWARKSLKMTGVTWVTREGGLFYNLCSGHSAHRGHDSPVPFTLQRDDQEGSWRPHLPLTQLPRPHLQGLRPTLVTSDTPFCSS